MGAAIPCTSTVTHVDVFARGASVTRRVALPHDLPSGDVTLRVDGASLIAESGSLRASLPEAPAHGRRVLLLCSYVEVPAEGSVVGPSVEAVRDLERRVERVVRERDLLHARRDLLRGVDLRPRARAARPPGDPSGAARRAVETLAADGVLDDLIADLDRAIAELDGALRAHRRALAAAEVVAAQARHDERVGEAHPRRVIELRLTGEGPLPWIDVAYAVPAARWWPVYTLRVTDSGKRAEWWVEALVAQRSGEDWRDARLSLSTADLLYDARLPELSSLRIGRAQPPPRSGYRDAPEGLDRLFAGYDKSVPAPYAPPAEAPAPEPAPADQMLHLDALAEESEGGDYDEAAAPAVRSRASATLEFQRVAPQSMPMPAAKRGGLFGGIGGAPGTARSEVSGAGAAPEPQPEPAVVPADAWMNFDALRVGGVDDRARRGVLRAQPEPGAEAARAQSLAALDALDAPSRARDPRVTRGVFDHRWEVSGLVEVPSDGRTHRVVMARKEATPTMRWRAVPVERPEVYREAEFRNPFGAPLLAGPVEVYVDGSLLAVAEIERVDRGGTLRVGMGVEDRLRVARNVRMREETTGLLSGTTVARHTVSIELSSAIGHPALVEVVDRVPVTDEKSIEVEVDRGDGEAFDQVERGAPVRGGRRWGVIVPAGGKAKVEMEYRVTLPAKNELVGGNRRG